MRRHLLPSACILLLLAASHAATPGYAGTLYMEPLYGFQETENIQYGLGKTTSGSMPLLLDVYQPIDIGKGQVQTNRPAVVIQDGGAWTSGDKDNGRVTYVAEFLVKRGYTVFIADYRQVGDSPAKAGSGPWNNLSPSSNSSLLGLYTTIYPGVNVVRVGIEDFAAAITYVRSNAATYGIDSGHIAGVGGSAGAINLLDLQYNGDTSAATYRTQANIAAVGSMMGDWNKVVAGGAPLFLWNNELDPLIYYYSDVEPNLHNQLEAKNIYYEQWMEYPDATDHNVHYDQYPLADPNCPHLQDKIGDQSLLIEDRIRDFLADHFTATGPVSLAGPAAPGDANYDGLVDGGDYTIWADHYLQTGQSWATGDFNGDRIVDGSDYTLWADNYAPPPAMASAVPEPSTRALLGLGAAVLLACGLLRHRQERFQFKNSIRNSTSTAVR